MDKADENIKKNDEENNNREREIKAGPSKALEPLSKPERKVKDLVFAAMHSSYVNVINT